MHTLNIPTTKGQIDVQVYNCESCRNLCVTMTSFGVFEITHTESGRKLYGGFERAANAIVEMMKVEVALISEGIDQPLSMNEFKERIVGSKVKFEELCSMTIMQYINHCRQHEDITNEFPWESYEDSPFAIIEKLKAKLDDQQ